jgi:hypothetical protein
MNEKECMEKGEWERKNLERNFESMPAKIKSRRGRMKQISRENKKKEARNSSRL